MNHYKLGVLLFVLGVMLGVMIIIGSMWWPEYTITTLGGIIVCIAFPLMVSGGMLMLPYDNSPGFFTLLYSALKKYNDEEE